MLLSVFILGLVALGFVLWVLLDRHEKRRVAAGLPRHGGPRIALAAAGLLTMLFAGGCSLLFALSMRPTGEQYVTWQSISIFGGPPFLVGLFVWWLSMRRKKANPPLP